MPKNQEPKFIAIKGDLKQSVKLTGKTPTDADYDYIYLPIKMLQDNHIVPTSIKILHFTDDDTVAGEQGYCFECEDISGKKMIIKKINYSKAQQEQNEERNATSSLKSIEHGFMNESNANLQSAINESNVTNAAHDIIPNNTCCIHSFYKAGNEEIPQEVCSSEGTIFLIEDRDTGIDIQTFLREMGNRTFTVSNNSIATKRYWKDGQLVAQQKRDEDLEYNRESVIGKLAGIFRDFDFNYESSLSEIDQNPANLDELNQVYNSMQRINECLNERSNDILDCYGQSVINLKRRCDWYITEGAVKQNPNVIVANIKKEILTEILLDLFSKWACPEMANIILEEIKTPLDGKNPDVWFDMIPDYNGTFKPDSIVQSIFNKAVEVINPIITNRTTIHNLIFNKDDFSDNDVYKALKEDSDVKPATQIAYIHELFAKLCSTDDSVVTKADKEKIAKNIFNTCIQIFKNNTLSDNPHRDDAFNYDVQNAFMLELQKLFTTSYSKDQEVLLENIKSMSSILTAKEIKHLTFFSSFKLTAHKKNVGSEFYRELNQVSFTNTTRNNSITMFIPNIQEFLQTHKDIKLNDNSKKVIFDNHEFTKQFILAQITKFYKSDHYITDNQMNNALTYLTQGKTPSEFKKFLLRLTPEKKFLTFIDKLNALSTDKKALLGNDFVASIVSENYITNDEPPIVDIKKVSASIDRLEKRITELGTFEIPNQITELLGITSANTKDSPIVFNGNSFYLENNLLFIQTKNGNSYNVVRASYQFNKEEIGDILVGLAEHIGGDKCKTDMQALLTNLNDICTIDDTYTDSNSEDGIYCNEISRYEKMYKFILAIKQEEQRYLKAQEKIRISYLKWINENGNALEQSAKQHKSPISILKEFQQKAITGINNALGLLKYLHDRGIDHNDQHWNNVFIDKTTLKPSLIDFGFSAMASTSDNDYCNDRMTIRNFNLLGNVVSYLYGSVDQMKEIYALQNLQITWGIHNKQAFNKLRNICKNNKVLLSGLSVKDMLSKAIELIKKEVNPDNQLIIDSITQLSNSDLPPQITAIGFGSLREVTDGYPNQDEITRIQEENLQICDNITKITEILDNISKYMPVKPEYMKIDMFQDMCRLKPDGTGEIDPEFLTLFKSNIFSTVEDDKEHFNVNLSNIDLSIEKDKEIVKLLLASNSDKYIVEDGVLKVRVDTYDSYTYENTNIETEFATYKRLHTIEGEDSIVVQIDKETLSSIWSLYDNTSEVYDFSNKLFKELLTQISSSDVLNLEIRDYEPNIEEKDFIETCIQLRKSPKFGGLKEKIQEHHSDWSEDKVLQESEEIIKIEARKLLAKRKSESLSRTDIESNNQLILDIANAQRKNPLIPMPTGQYYSTVNLPGHYLFSTAQKKWIEICENREESIDKVKKDRTISRSQKIKEIETINGDAIKEYKQFIDSTDFQLELKAINSGNSTMISAKKSKSDGSICTENGLYCKFEFTLDGNYHRKYYLYREETDEYKYVIPHTHNELILDEEYDLNHTLLTSKQMSNSTKLLLLHAINTDEVYEFKIPNRNEDELLIDVSEEMFGTLNDDQIRKIESLTPEDEIFPELKQRYLRYPLSLEQKQDINKAKEAAYQKRIELERQRFIDECNGLYKEQEKYKHPMINESQVLFAAKNFAKVYGISEKVAQILILSIRNASSDILKSVQIHGFDSPYFSLYLNVAKVVATSPLTAKMSPKKAAECISHSLLSQNPRISAIDAITLHIPGSKKSNLSVDMTINVSNTDFTTRQITYQIKRGEQVLKSKFESKKRLFQNVEKFETHQNENDALHIKQDFRAAQIIEELKANTLESFNYNSKEYAYKQQAIFAKYHILSINQGTFLETLNETRKLSDFRSVLTDNDNQIKLLKSISKGKIELPIQYRVKFYEYQKSIMGSAEQHNQQAEETYYSGKGCGMFDIKKRTRQYHNKDGNLIEEDEFFFDDLERAGIHTSIDEEKMNEFANRQRTFGERAMNFFRG